MLYPYEALEIPENSDDAAIRQAYLKKLRVHTPEHSPEEFQRISHANELIKDELSRAKLSVFGMKSTKSGCPLASLVRQTPLGRRVPVGLLAWKTTAKKS